MKDAYPRYKTGHLELIRSTLNPRDNKILKDFLIYCAGTSGEKKLKNIERTMLQIRDVMECSYCSFTLLKLRKFLSVLNNSDRSEHNKNDIKKTLKRFLKEYYPDWNMRFAGLKDIKTKDAMNHQRLNSNTILSSQELEKIIRAAENLRYKAIIILMFESAGRPEEILKLKWSDLDLERGEVKLHSAKTGRVRVNPIKESLIHLKRYQQEYPFPNIMAMDYVFPSPRNRKKSLTVASLDLYFNKLGKKALNKPLFPYLLRHTRATQLQKVLPPKIYEKFMDHSIAMAKRYSHLNKDDVREVMLEKIYHIEEISEEDKAEMSKLRVEVTKLKDENRALADEMKNYLGENNRNFRLLKDLSMIVQIMAKASVADKKTGIYLKRQLNKVFPEGESLISMHNKNP